MSAIIMKYEIRFVLEEYFKAFISDCRLKITLSVSISAIESPALILSPAFTFQTATFPDSIVGEREGIVIKVLGFNA
jgi:hypothetical protein